MTSLHPVTDPMAIAAIRQVNDYIATLVVVVTKTINNGVPQDGDESRRTLALDRAEHARRLYVEGHSGLALQALFESMALFGIDPLYAAIWADRYSPESAHWFTPQD